MKTTHKNKDYLKSEYDQQKKDDLKKKNILKKWRQHLNLKQSNEDSLKN